VPISNGKLCEYNPEMATTRLRLLSAQLSGGANPAPAAAAGRRRLRIAFGEYCEEADSFTAALATRADFEVNGIYEGNEMLDGRLNPASNSMLGGFLDVVGEPQHAAMIEPVPLFRANGGAAPTIAAAVHDEFCARMLTQLRLALASEGGVDAIFLSLHGAACAEQVDDVEGDLLRQVRALVGPDMPLAVSLDHHANITKEMATHANLLVGHQTQPHDPPDTGRKATRLLIDWLGTATADACSCSRPVMAWRKIPMMTQQDQYLTAPPGPMKVWFDMARAMEARYPEVLDVSPYPTQPWLDVDQAGWAVVVHTSTADHGGVLAERLASEMANFAWQQRDKFWDSERVDPAVAAGAALAAAARGPPAAAEEGGLLILSDTGDSTYGGGPGDSTHVARSLLTAQAAAIQDQPAKPGLLLIPMVDAEAVARCHSIGVGSQIDVAWALGGKVDFLSTPLELGAGEAQVLALGEPRAHDTRHMVVPRCALIGIGAAVRIAILESATGGINHPDLYTHLGIQIEEARAVVLKTASNFQYFAKWRSDLIRVDTPGMTQSNLRGFDWVKAPVPTHPLHAEAREGEWDADQGWLQ
jgi:microcystin degradation protein MlrC